LEVFGDGIADEMDIRLSALKAPDPVVDTQLPTGVKEVRVKGQGNQSTVLESQLNGDILHIKFQAPPSSATITVELLYGKQG
jgi:hypothetical protein